MESLSEKPWDVVIQGTGLQQSLLALALSRSKKHILHLDPNDYYGGPEAALTLQEAAAAAPDAYIWQHPDAAELGLSFPRAYSLALAPQIIHTRSRLLTQLVSSKAYRQVEFVAVGSFFVYEAAQDGEGAIISRIPSTREDVFANSTISAKSKRTLMKFLKFVMDYQSEENTAAWNAQADSELADFLRSQFKLDDDLRRYVLALTLTLDGKISVRDGLAILNRHFTSMGLFGPGFCAVYPKWGGLSEVVQVACRAGAVGGTVYMLNTSMTIGATNDDGLIALELSNGDTVQTKTLFTSQTVEKDAKTISRLVAIVNTNLSQLFENEVEGAPLPTVAVVAFPAGLASSAEAAPDAQNAPIYAMVHSGDTGECPKSQNSIYLTTPSLPGSKEKLENALAELLDMVKDPSPTCLWKLYYEQSVTGRTSTREDIGSNPIFSFPSLSPNLAFDDADLGTVEEAWKLAMAGEFHAQEFMNFEDREGIDAEDALE